MIFKRLKTDPAPFQDTWDGLKTAELRYDDRDYAVGEYLILKETRYTACAMALGNSGIDPECHVREYEEYPLAFTGREILVKITHILRDIDGVYGLKPGWCILSHELLSRESNVPGEG